MALAALAGSVLAEDWPQLQRDAAHTGYTAEGPNPPFTLKWSRDLGEPFHPAHQPVVAGGDLFAGTAWGNLYALDRVTGDTVWMYHTDGPILGSPAWADRLVYVNSMDGRCHAVDAVDGRSLWTFHTGAGIWAAPVIADGKVFVAGRDGFVYALNPADGKLVWKQPVPSLVMCTPAWCDDKLYVACGDMRVYALDSKTGQPVWTSPQMHGMAFRDYWVAAHADAIVLSAQLVSNTHDAMHQIQSQVMDKFRAGQVDSEVLVEDPVFPMLKDWFAKNPSCRMYFVLDAQTGQEKFVPPIVGVHGGGCASPLPSISPDGWAYLPYANITLGASGQTFLGRLNLRTGEMDPLLKGWFATPPARGYWVRQPASGRRYDRSSDWSGGFGVCDHSWGNSQAGDWLYNVREAGWVPDSKLSMNMVNLRTGQDTRVTNGLDSRTFHQGTYNGMFHATSSPAVISDRDVFYKSIRNVLYAFEGQP
jgi:outer membrane protein assembly factor BamB